MASYEYTAKDESGSKFSSTYSNIDNVATLRQELAKSGFALIKARQYKDPKVRRCRIKQSEVVTFVYKFAGMYAAGIPIVSCLETLEEQAENQTSKYIIGDIRQSVESGSSLAKAFSKYRDTFSDFFLGMIQAGETGGRMATALEMSAAYLEKQADLKRKIKSAFAYPVMVSIMSLAVVVFILTFIIPVFEKLYRQIHVPLPDSTRLLLYLSLLVRDRWSLILIAGVGAVIMLKYFFKNPKFRAWWDVFKLDIPVFGNLNRMVVVSNFTRTFSMMLSVGIPLTEALETASHVACNHKLNQIVKELQESIKAGKPIAETLKKYDIFPPIITQLASSGEEAGMLSEMLNKGTDFLNKDIDRTIKALLVKLEPALMVIMGAVVGFILISAYLPMFDYMAHLK